ncbi:MFS transporter [Lysobacter enzymogenes]|uniref:MFS transporter n=1 Tax=Lysobacter enzymogenes TaxID=69 RepID=UPI00089BDD18|nr:MFS transporter [Lysobacter enzymogenes]SDX23791.1 Major Facilitator Superfamily protein [Lysobacter enzymogenes]
MSARRSAAARLLRIGRRDRRPAWLLLDNLITTFGAAFTLIALPFLVMRLSGRALDLGAVAAIEALPSLVLLFAFRGALDRFDPARLLWWCRAAYVAINLTLAAATWFDAMSLELIYALALIGGIVWAVAYPAGRACFGLYLRRGLLAPANAVFALASSVATMAMPMLAGGLILSSSGPHALAAAFAVDALCVAASLPLIAALRRRGPARGREAVDAEAGAATTNAATVNAPAIARSYYLYLLASSLLAFGPVQILLPVLLVQRHDPRYLAVYAAQFLGVSLAAALAARRPPERMERILYGVAGCWLAAALAYVLLGWGAAAWPLGATVLAFGLLAAASNHYGIRSLSWLQRRADPRRMGREMTWFSAATMGAMPLAALATGWLIETRGLAGASLTLAAALAACALAGAMHLHLRATVARAASPRDGAASPAAFAADD